MSPPIAIGAGGLTGWAVLKRSGDAQRQAMARDPVVNRAVDHFRANIAKATPESLVGDYRMLSVALGAFGLEGDIANKAFIRKVLESDRNDDTSLVNRLSDKRYRRLADALQMDRGTEQTSKPGFGDRFAALYITREFERRVGEADETLRLAMNAQRELSGMATRNSTDRTLWFEVLGNPPLRQFFETAFGFGPAYAKLPVDRQVEEFMTRAVKVTGTTSFKGYAEAAGSEKLIRTFLVRAQLAEGGGVNTSRYANALALLTRG
ncbi:DUF1217 domain-containing protein (plasmid) [Paracoccus sp. TK19116]|uniref:DUF1217 domain-containing protein n=1 Tax=Paracoccus albicereus TaxID=2922394 RepID=A0ABT1MLT4_9RHOB|nr:DUF1217 domain-containing protein [Paracoccus albicereus]MCQ0969230.1 DUF1217 domain-containing protein [Paracoccus albicereus]